MNGTAVGTLILALATAGVGQTPRTPVLEEEVETARVLVDMRVVDIDGWPLTDLGQENFAVEVDGKPVRVTSLDFFAPGDALPLRRGVGVADEPGPDPSRAAELAPPGRRIVLFFQRSLVPSRIVGMMLFQDEVERLIGTLDPADEVAVFLYDSSLKFFADFTNDHEAILALLRDSIVQYRRPETQPWRDARPDGAAAHFDPEAAEQAATPEQALLVVARALQPLPGPKSLLYIGWGLGRYDGGVISMQPAWDEARVAMMKARTALFALDFTQADYHTLEIPLTHVALETGGFYAKTYPIHTAAVDQVRRAIDARYELAFEKPELGPGLHRIRVELRGVRGVVYHRDAYAD